MGDYDFLKKLEINELELLSEKIKTIKGIIELNKEISYVKSNKVSMLMIDIDDKENENVEKNISLTNINEEDEKKDCSHSLTINQKIKLKDLSLPYEVEKIIKEYNLVTIDDLINTDFSSFSNISSSVKKSIEWVKKEYDYSAFESDLLTRKKK